MTTRVRGVFSPVVTPFNADLSVNFEKLVQQCRWLQDNHVGIAILGTNSEANSLSLTERLDMIDALFEAGINPQKMMPGTGACDLPTAIALTKKATEGNCVGVLTLPPFYYKNVSDDGLFDYYARLIEGVANDNLRVYLYHIPQVSNTPISLALIERLLKAYPQQVAGIKDSSGDWDNTLAMLNQFSADGFDVFPGSETFLLEGLRHGGAGCISATANVNPAGIHEVFATYTADNADAMQARLNEIRGIFQNFPMIPAMKAAIAHWSNDAAWKVVRPPLVSLSEDDQATLIQQLKAANFEMKGLQ